MTTTSLTRIVSSMFVGLFLLSATTEAQPPPEERTATLAGRFQLTVAEGDAMFLVDSASGRVWRYTSSVEVEIERQVEQLVGARVKASPDSTSPRTTGHGPGTTRRWRSRRCKSQRTVSRAPTSVPVSGAEHNRVQTDNPTGAVFRLLTGFPPRYFVRLDPR